jgi:hypothetical protein
LSQRGDMIDVDAEPKGFHVTRRARASTTTGES